MAKVLIADDDLFYREIISRCIQSMGHGSHSVRDGREALRLLTREPFDLLILDVFMDKMGGLDLLLGLTNISETSGASRIPTIIVTSDDSKDTEQQAREAKATFFLLKPFHPETLATVVEQALRTSNASRASMRSTASVASG